MIESTLEVLKINIAGQDNKVSLAEVRALAARALVFPEKTLQTKEFWIRATMGMVDLIDQADMRSQGRVATTIMEYCTCSNKHTMHGEIDPKCLAHAIIEALPMGPTGGKRRISG